MCFVIYMRVGKSVLVVPIVLGACGALPFKEEIVFEGHNTGVSNTVEFPIEAVPLDAISIKEPATAEPEVLEPVRTRESMRAGPLGVTVGALGSPTEAGLWIKTPLIDAVAMGTATVVETGKSVKLELRPIKGQASAGSRVSLAAMRALGLPLTALAELELSVGD
jgi:hypothetical protein